MIRIAVSNCKILLHSWIVPRTNLVLGGKELSEDNSSYLINCITSSGRILDGVMSRKQNGRLAPSI